MTTVEKHNKLKEFDSEKIFREFLVDLLKRRGFSDVIHTHRFGAPEQGKDIIAKLYHNVEGEEWYAFVVKKGRIGGGTLEIETIKGQIKQAFEYAYQGINGEKIKINKVKVVTNENFTGGAQDQITNSPQLSVYNNYSFWWNENLTPIIDEYYSDFWLPGDSFAKEYSKSFKQKVQQEIELRELSIHPINDKNIQKLLNIFIEPKLSISYIEEDKLTKEKQVKRKNINVNSIDKIEENLILSGEQGSGKTKILNTIACQIGTPDAIFESKTIPVKLNATIIKNNEYNIDLSIAKSITELTENLILPETIIDYRKILFIDNLDLLKNEEKELLVQKAKSYCLENNTYFVIAHRKNEFSFDDEINSIKIHNFNKKQIELFITKFFEGSDRGSKFIQILKESDILSKLPTTPLTITLISLLYDENSYEIPATLSDIYTDFTSILLGKLSITNKNDLIILNIKRRIFTTLALKMLDSKVFEITFKEFIEHTNSFLSERDYQSQTDDEINEILENSGLLYRSDADLVGFKQQAFIEFLASLEIYHNKRETHYNKLISNFNDVTWQNTAIFYAGHAKELVNMIDDVIMHSPNLNLRDWFINTGGMGYLAQALYQSSPKERMKLVLKSLDNLEKSFYQLKDDSKNEGNMFYNIPIPLLLAIVNFWFNENFKSITLTNTLIKSFEELYNNGNNDFETNYKLLMISTTLMNPYINNESCFAKLIERKEFIAHPILPLVADIIMETGKINQHKVSSEIRESIKKSIQKKKDYIKAIFKEPAYRFNDDFSLGE
jgi:hypothetical protein